MEVRGDRGDLAAPRVVAQGLQDETRPVGRGVGVALSVFGVADRYGSLQAGKVANVVVWSGDPFEFTTAVEHVFIRGREIPLRSRQTELLERYKTLPPKY